MINSAEEIIHANHSRNLALRLDKHTYMQLQVGSTNIQLDIMPDFVRNIIHFLVRSNDTAYTSRVEKDLPDKFKPTSGQNIMSDALGGLDD